MDKNSACKQRVAVQEKDGSVSITLAAFGFSQSFSILY